MSGDRSEENNGGKELTVKEKRKRLLVSGKKRNVSVVNVRSRSEEHGVSFGAAGWPPPFESLVCKMRRTITNDLSITNLF